MKKIFFSLLIAFQSSFLLAQENQVLFTLDGNPVSTTEFEKVYTKNNINNQADYSEASLNEYLNLFINFKLKVAEAESLQMDTIPAIKNELKTYQKQLVSNYANDKKVSEDLLKEAYERSKLEVDASHLLLRWPNAYPSSADSAKLLKEILTIKKGLSPSNFAQQAKLKSQDPSAKDNQGRLGYLSAFQTVYPFENTLYSTKVGEISDPVATQFGYHLVLVHDVRRARGKIKTAHLLLKSKAEDDSEKKKAVKEKIESIHKQLVAGEIDFPTAVKQYSEDKKTKFQGGKLPELSSAEMIAEFADAAFSLENDGDFSEPVLTSIGWHIIQRVSKSEMGEFEEAKPILSNKIARDSRSNVAQAINNEDSKKKFGFTMNKKALDEVIMDLSKSYDSGTFKLENDKYSKELFTIGSSSYTQKDYLTYAKKTITKVGELNSLPALIKNNYDRFQSDRIQGYREEHLAEINEDYKDLMQEYHDGILLFELTDKEVWSKAVKDTTGLREFHEQHKMNYMWPERVMVTKYVFADQKSADKAIKLFNKGKSASDVLKKINKKETLVTSNSVKQVKSDFQPAQATLSVGSTVQQELEGGKIEYQVVEAILSPEPKLLKETRGYVISDYQSYLEKEWIKSLKQKYTVSVDKDVFQSLIR